MTHIRWFRKERADHRQQQQRQRWWELASQAMLIGVSAAVSHHLLATLSPSPPPVVAVVKRARKELAVVKKWVHELPRWFCIAFPAYAFLATGRRSMLFASSLSIALMRLLSDPESDDEATESNDGTSRESPMKRDNDNSSQWPNVPRKAPTTEATDEDDLFKTTNAIFRTVPREKGFPPKSAKGRETPQRYLELLVHNVSHTDLVLGLEPHHAEEKECYIRPRFSTFDMLSRLVLGYVRLENDATKNVVNFPLHQRTDDKRHSICQSDQDSPETPTGLQLKNPAPLPETCGMQDIRARELDETRIEGLFQEEGSRPPRINHVFFPLLATLLPAWRRQIEGKEYKSPFERVLVLVTGVGTPRNRTHSVSGNSTKACADLMELFLHTVDPGLTVVKIHSETNLFRYDENLSFVEKELLPILHGYRDAQATGNPYPHERKHLTRNKAPFDTEWRSSMHVTLSSADGSGARTHAIQASLRPFRPTYFHFWQLKTFWHESKIVEDDIEVHSFETMQNLPPRDVDQIKDKDMQLVIAEMRAFYQDMVVALATNENDIQSFWLRKTHKPVLAVLLVRSGETPQLYRGSNMEVSMPTGSLCAERNAIGSALSMNPKLKREDLKMVAVLAVPPVELSLDDGGMPRVQSVSSFVEEFGGEGRPAGSRKPSLGSEGDSGEWILSDQMEAATKQMNASPSVSDIVDDQQASAAPLRRIMLYSKTNNARRGKRTVVIQSTKDMNPLKPCGACNEWLKKIAESNPYFKIITFTDANCNGVYCQPCQE